MNKKLIILLITIATFDFSVSAANYLGNGNTGFGGAVGLGSLDVTDNGTTITLTLNRGAGPFNDGLAIYIDSAVGGFADTSGFFDNGDSGRSVVSGNNGGQSVVTFASGFAPEYAVSIQNGYASLFQLANGVANSFTWITGSSQSGVNNSATYSLSFTLSDIGLTPGAGQSINLFGTYTSDTGYRSTEAVAGDATGTQGSNPFTQASFVTYMTTPVPEPSSMVLAGSGLVLLYLIRRRR